ncbi:diflavin oxidoreductase [Pectobacterium jejuense]|uniref:diflavin oxidoreductase n=1 Tax=Pectobacterium jejuense TaxID=2974022 RepID=UPI00227DA4E5|nr:sulfite reductase flavoprotein subunit alpha [Pectobacterium jejuense]MCY9849693.1 sulfite reductase flavoprotein subunit alpha [Pectobacterium jejuense]
MADLIERILIGYGSESGNARALAISLGEQGALQPFRPQVMELNDVLQEQPGERDVLLIVSSSFGDGEPPANAERFLEQLDHYSSVDTLCYAIFGLGDTAYPRFCGFSKLLDSTLAARGARAIINRVDADANYQGFFSNWLSVVEKVLHGDEQAGRDLLLQVTAYGEDNAFSARVLERRRLNIDAPYAWHVRLSIADSGIRYRAGDTLYLQPENDPALLSQLAAWFDCADAAEALRDKELRQISKTVLRELARLSANDELKGMLKISQRKALEAYLYGADLLDVLTDFCTPEVVSLEALAGILSPCMPRAYSIVSCADEQRVDLCVREVCYERGGRRRKGVATGWLLGEHQQMRIFSRANPGFWLPPDISTPVLMIGTGTGIAPLLALLCEQATLETSRETCLIFGEKHREGDFLYQDELESLCERGVLGKMFTAFSRDSASKYYVQHAILEQAEYIGDMLRRGAHIYLCGNRQHLESAVEEALTEVCTREGLTAERLWSTLTQQGRLHLELY